MIWGTLFSGCGGVDCGLLQAGHTVAWGVEIDPAIADIYSANHPSIPLFRNDVRSVDLAALSPIDALWASPVCKQDSKARLQTLDRREDASIGTAIIRYVKHFQPELIILENVDGYKKNPALTTLIAYLSKHYALSERVLNASNYGVPQDRARLVIQARKGPIAWPDYLPQQVSWYDAIADLLPTMQAWHLANWQQLLWKPEYDLMLPALVHGHYAYHRNKQDARELDILPASALARTVTSSHNVLQRYIVLETGAVLKPTIQAIARWQSFPDTYQWPGTLTAAVKAIGNAVPPRLVQKLTENYKGYRQQMEDDGDVA
jgi:DNA (cytosine-5)-methyltransferase 1